MEDSAKRRNINDDSSSSSGSKSKTASLECKVCSAPAVHSNYGAVTCYPCKMFFKRHATSTEQKQLTCDFNNQCEINISNRHVCSACRLSKCFTNGMQRELIRGPIPKKKARNSDENLTAISNILTTMNKPVRSQSLTTANLSQEDQSILTTSQWTLLSNLIYSYNENNIISLIENLNEFKFDDEIFDKIYELTIAYISSNGDFRLLSSDDRSIYLRSIVENLTCLSLVLCYNQSKIYRCQQIMDIYLKYYGENLVHLFEQITKLIDSDITIIKLSISLFAFSINSTIFLQHRTMKLIQTSTMSRIQNIYADVLWKYLIYKYGYFQSTQRLTAVTQFLLIATNIVSEMQHCTKHVNDIELLTEKIELLLLVDDIEHIEENR